MRNVIIRVNVCIVDKAAPEVFGQTGVVMETQVPFMEIDKKTLRELMVQLKDAVETMNDRMIVAYGGE